MLGEGWLLKECTTVMLRKQSEVTSFLRNSFEWRYSERQSNRFYSLDFPFSFPHGRQEHGKAAANTSSALTRRLWQIPRDPHLAPSAGRCAAGMNWNGCGKGKGSKVCGKGSFAFVWCWGSNHGSCVCMLDVKFCL